MFYSNSKVMLCGNISVYIFTKLCYPENLLAAHAWLTHSGIETASKGYN